MMGVVYEAVDPVLGRTIALKTIQLAFSATAAEREVFEKRFFTEARVAARLSHSGILVVHDVGRDADTGLLYIALEYLKGRTLATGLDSGSPLEWREVLRIVRGVADALHHAHAEGVVHRDIKPANIMLLPDGSTKIMDFGIAKFEAASGGLTSTGQFFGTPAYMAPEQAMEQKVDGRADLFSLGATAYTLLTGQLAFGAENFVAIITRVTRHDPPPPSRLAPGVPPEVDYLLARALAKAPADRFPTARMLADDIDDILAGRPPRHRASWNPPVPAEGTVVAAGAAPPAQSGPHPSAPPPTPRAATGRRVTQPGAARPAASASSRMYWLALLGAALIGAAAAGVAMLRVAPAGSGSTAAGVSSSRASEPPTGPAEAQAMPTPAPVLPAAETPMPLPVPTTPAAAAEARATATPKPRPRPARTAAATLPPAQSAPEPAPATATLAVDFEHPLKDGTLRLFLNGALLLEERLESRAKKVVGLTMRKGSLRRVFSVPPGEHDLRVEVTWGDQKKVGAVWGKLVARETRTLEIRMPPVLKTLSVEWK